MSITDLLQSAASIVNSVLGADCIYEHRTGDTTENVHITVDRNKIIKDSVGFIAGYAVEASILKSEIPKIYNDEYFTTDKNVRFRITQVTKETTAKWYVDITEI